MTLTLEPQIVAIIAVGLGVLLCLMILYSFWRRTAQEFFAARIAVTNLQQRVARIEQDELLRKHAKQEMQKKEEEQKKGPAFKDGLDVVIEQLEDDESILKRRLDYLKKHMR